ncbi:MAG: 4-(cytidine 5'-diphospho)-2-C-methyl-D-erythritol kinase [bacterium]|nr:4-(cytidine 5'-diphospho)-2-C-methyl-D-erythritol kinase [bacterium]
MGGIVVQAPAKINLVLRVLGKRPDGYHEIESIMQMVSLYDTLSIEEGGRGILLETDHPDLPVGEENLIVRAARLACDETGRQPALRIGLKKKIPIAAGLGGGSSDAAATLGGLNRLWGEPIAAKRLSVLAESLGMDVPFFLDGPTALATGRGERLEKLPPPSPPLSVLLVNPGIKVSTAAAYGALKLGLTIANKHISIRRFFIATFEEARAVLENDLEQVTLKAYPEIREIKESLLKLGALGALMSGSGSTVFGLFPDLESATTAKRAFAARPDHSVHLAQTLSAVPG